MLSRSYLILLFLLLSVHIGQAQVLSDSVAVMDSVKMDSLSFDTSFAAMADSILIDEPVFETIFPWINQRNIGFNTVRNDSSLRWEIWPNWGDYYAYRPDALAYRLGTTGRLDAYDILGFGPYHQRVELEGITINNPITGLVNYNFIPNTKLSTVEERFGGLYETRIKLKDYYLEQPLSQLNLDESDFSYRNLEFMVAQNFTEKTNLEISFWDRRDGGNYVQNDVQGNQILFKGYHYLKRNTLIRATFLRNEINREESFGYTIDDPFVYTFNEFTTIANQNNSQSKSLRRDFIVGIYSRSDTLSEENAGLSISHTKNEFDQPNTLDSLFWDVNSIRFNGFKRFDTSKLSSRIHIESTFNKVQSARNFTRNNWFDARLDLDNLLTMSRNSTIQFFGNLTYRTTSHIGYSVSAGPQFRIGNHSTLTLLFSQNSTMPTIQSLYWNSRYVGNSNLKNTSSTTIFGEFKTQPSEKITWGIRSNNSLVNNSIIASSSRIFSNSEEFIKYAGSLYGVYNSERLLIESSVNGVGYISSDNSESGLEVPDPTIWIRNNIFLQGYLYNRATYVKGGVRTVLSPLNYTPKSFISELQYWGNSSSIDWINPSYFRMDAELSARLRSMMILIRWENLLDGIGQVGYFETESYPMPGRRLIIGIRAQFRN